MSSKEKEDSSGWSGSVNVVDDLLEQLLSMTTSSAEAGPVTIEAQHPEPEASEVVEVGITRISYRGYKALGYYDLPLRQINILTGTNNAGKSTALSAIRILAAGLSLATRRKPTPIETPEGKKHGYVVPRNGSTEQRQRE